MSDLKEAVCDPCDWVFLQWPDAQRHEIDYHRPVSCGECRKDFEGLKKFETHFTGIRMHPIRCQCGKWFGAAQNLGDIEEYLRHVKAEHSILDPHCGGIFESNDAYRRHAQTDEEHGRRVEEKLRKEEAVLDTRKMAWMQYEQELEADREKSRRAAIEEEDFEAQRWKEQEENAIDWSTYVDQPPTAPVSGNPETNTCRKTPAEYCRGLYGIMPHEDSSSSFVDDEESLSPYAKAGMAKQKRLPKTFRSRAQHRQRYLKHLFNGENHPNCKIDYSAREVFERLAENKDPNKNMTLQTDIREKLLQNGLALPTSWNKRKIQRFSAIVVYDIKEDLSEILSTEIEALATVQNNVQASNASSILQSSEEPSSMKEEVSTKIAAKSPLVASSKYRLLTESSAICLPPSENSKMSVDSSSEVASLYTKRNPDKLEFEITDNQLQDIDKGYLATKQISSLKEPLEQEPLSEISQAIQPVMTENKEKPQEIVEESTELPPNAMIEPSRTPLTIINGLEENKVDTKLDDDKKGDKSLAKHEDEPSAKNSDLEKPAIMNRDEITDLKAGLLALKKSLRSSENEARKWKDAAETFQEGHLSSQKLSLSYFEMMQRQEGAARKQNFEVEKLKKEVATLKGNNPAQQRPNIPPQFMQELAQLKAKLAESEKEKEAANWDLEKKKDEIRQLKEDRAKATRVVHQRNLQIEVMRNSIENLTHENERCRKALTAQSTVRSKPKEEGPTSATPPKSSPTSPNAKDNNDEKEE